LAKSSSRGTYLRRNTPSVGPLTRRVDRLMALIELAGGDNLDCSRLVMCIDRNTDQAAKGIARDLAWVGFELVTLEPWTGKMETSQEWLLLAMEV
jgi:hypothetical protein